LGFPPFTTAVLESSILVLVGLKRRENREKERRERDWFGVFFLEGVGFILSERERERERKFCRGGRKVGLGFSRAFYLSNLFPLVCLVRN